jgi:MraZ protein
MAKPGELKGRWAMGLFLGTHTNKVDRKGRVSVPAQFRTALAQESFQGIILYRSLSHDGVIEGCGMAFLEQIAAASARQFDVFSEEMEDVGAAISGDSVQLPWDPEGRVVLPAYLLEHANIFDQIAFVGMFQRFQLWHPDAYAAHERQVKARIKTNKPKLLLQRPEG